MKNMTTRMMVTLAVLAVMTGSSALAQNLAPSWRGQPGSAYREWRFDSGANPSSPELSSAAAPAQAAVDAGLFSIGWNHQVPGMGADQSGLWDLGRSGTITMMLNNAGVAEPAVYQRISVQVSQWLDGSIYSERANVSVPGATPAGE